MKDFVKFGIHIGWIDMLSKIDTSKINLILKTNLHLLTNFDSFLKKNMPKSFNDKFWKCDQIKQKILKQNMYVNEKGN
jgi:hypothetical protein